MTRYTGSADGTNLAYQAGGDGPLELVFRHGTHPSLGRMCRVSVACARFRIVLGRPEEPHILGVTPSVVTLTDPIFINEGPWGNQWSPRRNSRVTSQLHVHTIGRRHCWLRCPLWVQWLERDDNDYRCHRSDDFWHEFGVHGLSIRDSPEQEVFVAEHGRPFVIRALNVEGCPRTE